MAEGFTPIFVGTGAGHRAGAVPDPPTGTPVDYVLWANATWGPCHSVAPPILLPGETVNQSACNIAGQFVDLICKEGIQLAIDQLLGIPRGWGLLFGLIDTIPGLGDFAIRFSLSLQSIELSLFTSIASEWALAKAEELLWSQIGCVVYNALLTTGAWTEDARANIMTALGSLVTDHPNVVSVVIAILANLDAAALNGLSASANVTNYDCSGCTGGTGPVLTPPAVIGLRHPPQGWMIASGDTGPTFAEPSLNFIDSPNIKASVSDNPAGQSIVVDFDLAEGATGDILVDSGAGWVKLPVGAAGKVLTSTGTGLTYTPKPRVIMQDGATHPPVPIWNVDGTDWIYTS